MITVILIARKPLLESTIAKNVLKFDAGAINIDGCRIGATVKTWPKSRSYSASDVDGHGSFRPGGHGVIQQTQPPPSGRWSANLMLEDCEDVKDRFPSNVKGARHFNNDGAPTDYQTSGSDSSSGSASRFFKQFKDDTV